MDPIVLSAALALLTMLAGPAVGPTPVVPGGVNPTADLPGGPDTRAVGGFERQP